MDNDTQGDLVHAATEVQQRQDLAALDKHHLRHARLSRARMELLPNVLRIDMTLYILATLSTWALLAAFVAIIGVKP